MQFRWGPMLTRARLLQVRKRHSHNMTEPDALSPAYSALGPTHNMTGNPALSPDVDVQLRNRTGVSAMAHADQGFMKKTGMIRDMLSHPTKSQSFTMVVVIASIFLFVTMAITTVVVVFCRRRNTVFAFQKSEQEDYPDYEMEEMETDIEYDESDNESETDSLQRQKRPSREASCPLVGTRRPPQAKRHRCHCDDGKQRGDYQMVVTAVLEQPPPASSEASSMLRNGTGSNSQQMFYGLTNMPPGLFQSSSNKPPVMGPFRGPKVNITYTDRTPQAPPPPESTYAVVVTLDNMSKEQRLRGSSSDYDIRYHTSTANEAPPTKTVDSKGATPLYVHLPPLEQTCLLEEIHEEPIGAKRSLSLKSSTPEGATNANNNNPHSLPPTPMDGVPATHFLAMGAERLCGRGLERVGSIRSLSRDQYLSLLSVRSSSFPIQATDFSSASQTLHGSSSEQEALLLEEYFNVNYADDDMFSD